MTANLFIHVSPHVRELDWCRDVGWYYPDPHVNRHAGFRRFPRRDSFSRPRSGDYMFLSAFIFLLQFLKCALSVIRAPSRDQSNTISSAGLRERQEYLNDKDFAAPAQVCAGISGVVPPFRRLDGPGGADAFTGAEIMPVSREPITDGVLVIEDGKIVHVGAAGRTRIPSDAKVIDISGQVIVPGFVDTHSHIGEPAGGDRSGPIQPEARALDSINIRDAGFRRALAGGLTTGNIMP